MIVNIFFIKKMKNIIVELNINNFLKSKFSKYSLICGFYILLIKIDGSDNNITKPAKDPNPTVSINDTINVPKKIIISLILCVLFVKNLIFLKKKFIL